jgi:hypothetical protein
MSIPRLSQRLAVLLCLLLGVCTASADDMPKREDFAWRATLAVPPGASLARVALPAEALARLQTADARDLRVFNAEGEAVAYSLAGTQAVNHQLAAQFTPTYQALPLYAATSGKTPGKGSVQVRVNTPGGAQTVWVQLEQGAGATATGTPVKSALFATRDEKQAITAITLQGELPANVPVQIGASVSTDLAQWTPVALSGRLYRFEGEGAPANTTLELEQPLALQGRYLRLDWDGFDGVRITGMAGRIAQATPTLARPRLPLTNATAQGKAALEWPLDFATPMAALAIATTRPNSLVPVRVLGRSEPGQTWRQLGQGVVYRLGPDGSPQAVSPPIPLSHMPVRWLRVEATNGMELPAANLQVSVEFEPLQTVFLASGSSPFELAVGRAGTYTAAVPLAMLTATVAGKLEDIAPATVANVLSAKQAGGSSAGNWVSRSTVLWAVLVGGVLVLGAVAVGLLKQLKTGSVEFQVGCPA